MRGVECGCAMGYRVYGVMRNVGCGVECALGYGVCGVE